MQETDKWIRGLFLDSLEMELHGKCHDCGKDICIIGHIKENEYELSGGYVWKMMDCDNPFFKCMDCYEKNPMLINFQPTEVYSRVCGYLRPVKQWNKGKQAEQAMRKVYNMEKVINV